MLTNYYDANSGPMLSVLLGFERFQRSLWSKAEAEAADLRPLLANRWAAGSAYLSRASAFGSISVVSFKNRQEDCLEE